MSFLDNMVDLQNVRPGATAILKLSYNATFDVIHFFLGGGLTKANITRIEGKANGTTFFVDDGAKLAARDAYAGIFSDPNIISLDFTEPNTKGGAPAQYLASLPRNKLKSLTFELTIDAAANVNSTLRAKAEFRGPTENPFILRRKDFNVALPTVGENDLVLPSQLSGGLIKRIWIHHTGHVVEALLQTDGVPRMRTKVGDLEYTQKRKKIVPQANLLVLDFIADGNLMGMLNTQGVTEALLRLTTDAADTAKVYVDYIDDISRLT